MTEAFQPRIKKIMANNTKCVDCGASYPTWISATFGVVMCPQCAGVHRSLGTRHSFVRSLTLDELTEDEVIICEICGNDRANRFFAEQGVPKSIQERYKSATARRFAAQLREEMGLESIEYGSSSVASSDVAQEKAISGLNDTTTSASSTGTRVAPVRSGRSLLRPAQPASPKMENTQSQKRGLMFGASSASASSSTNTGSRAFGAVSSEDEEEYTQPRSSSSENHEELGEDEYRAPDGSVYGGWGGRLSEPRSAGLSRGTPTGEKIRQLRTKLPSSEQVKKGAITVGKTVGKGAQNFWTQAKRFVNESRSAFAGNDDIDL